MNSDDLAESQDLPGNLREAFKAGKHGWPSPAELAEKNPGIVTTDDEQEYWEKGRQAAAQA